MSGLTGLTTFDGGGPPVVCGDAGAPSTLTVNVDQAKSVVSDGIFGVLMERIGNDITGGLYVGTSSSIPNTSGMRNDIIQGFKDAHVGLIEWPGGCAANTYAWKTTSPANDMGTDDYMQLTSLLGIDTVIAGPGTAAGATSNQQWLQYIDQNTSHPTWTINNFKIGNEVWGCGGNQTESQYETNYLANYALLSTPINGKQAKLIASTGLIDTSLSAGGWVETELKNIGSKIDGLEIHDYIYHPSDIPCTGFSDAQYYNVVNAANTGQIGPRITQIRKLLDTYDPNNRIKIYEDEWGDWLEAFPNPPAGSGGFDFQQITLMDAISTAETLNLFVQNADRYAMGGLAQAINVIHSLFLTSGAQLVKTPSFYVFKMLAPHHSCGAEAAPSTLTSEMITGNGTTFPVLSAATTVDTSGDVNISLANVDLVNTRSLQVTLNSSSHASYSVSTAEVITAPADDSYNDFGKAETVNVQLLPSTSYAICGKSLSVTLPSKSVVMLVLTPQ